MTDLKPCPFCGSDAIAIIGMASYYVRCPDPNCAIAIFAQNMNEAVIKWNKRVNK